jgi:hypothetical protein
MVAMRMIWPAAMSLLTLGALGAGCRWGGEEAAAAGASARPAAASSGPAVLVELFTSQGCSSCPPADRLLGALPGEVDGVQVLPLAFHVDYWDDLGWRDPFSSAAWTARQNRYAHALGAGRIYTPQLVVMGTADVVGSDRGKAIDLIRKAAGRPASGARIQATTASGQQALTVSVDAALGAAKPGPARADAWVALVENGLATMVARGENQGRGLVDHFVVRRLTRAFTVEAGRPRRGDVELALESTWRRDRMAVTVFLQDEKDLAVLAAAAARPR